jgi:exopolysaccharide biosynthesis protein
MKKIFLFLLLTSFIFIFADTKALAWGYYKINNDSEGIYVVEVNTKKSKCNLEPYVVTLLETNKSVYDRLNPRFVVNAGFFDPKNHQTVSYVTIDGHQVLNPKNNSNLMENEALKPYMDKILDRSEFRVLENPKGKLKYDIATHNTPVEKGYKLKHSIQAGPMLYPDLRLEDEFFILVRDGKIISESASSLHKYARTGIGIKENKVYLFIVTGKSPMTLEELSDLTKKWGMEKAMAFDGGGSTSFDSKELHIISQEAGQGRKLKSFLILK